MTFPLDRFKPPQPVGITFVTDNGQTTVELEPVSFRFENGAWAKRLASNAAYGESDWWGPGGEIISWHGPVGGMTGNASASPNVYRDGVLYAALPSPWTVGGACINGTELRVIGVDYSGEQLRFFKTPLSGLPDESPTWTFVDTKPFPASPDPTNYPFPLTARETFNGFHFNQSGTAGGAVIWYANQATSSSTMVARSAIVRFTWGATIGLSISGFRSLDGVQINDRVVQNLDLEDAFAEPEVFGGRDSIREFFYSGSEYAGIGYDGDTERLAWFEGDESAVLTFTDYRIEAEVSGPIFAMYRQHRFGRTGGNQLLFKRDGFPDIVVRAETHRSDSKTWYEEDSVAPDADAVSTLAIDRDIIEGGILYCDLRTGLTVTYHNVDTDTLAEDVAVWGGYPDNPPLTSNTLTERDERKQGTPTDDDILSDETVTIAPAEHETRLTGSTNPYRWSEYLGSVLPVHVVDASPGQDILAPRKMAAAYPDGTWFTLFEFDFTVSDDERATLFSNGDDLPTLVNWATYHAVPEKVRAKRINDTVGIV